MTITLRVLVGPELAEEIRVGSVKFLIGRAEDCHLRPNCPMVSRHHCELIVDGDHVTVRDHHSKNGTYVNGLRVDAEMELHSGDQIDLGLRKLCVEIRPDVPTGDKDRQLIVPMSTSA